MATRRSKKVNKRFAKVNEEWPDKDGTSANKINSRKRKLADMLGSQWSKEELTRFYESYRKYGKDWRKVAATIRNRSIEMVEALYNMNRAYLSLAEGSASAPGLIAMMTDHYDNLEGSDSGRESNDVSKMPRKTQKRGRGKFRRMSKGTDKHFPESSPASYGCLSLLKGKHSGDLLAGSRPRVVGKRTPRIPVSNMSVKDKIVSPYSRQGLKSVYSTADDEGAHVAALALAEAFQRGESPHVPQTPVSSARKNYETVIENSKSIGVHMDDDSFEGSLGSRAAENGDFTRVVESADVSKDHQRVKKLQGNLPKSGTIKNDDFDDETEACSGTEERNTRRRIKDEIGFEDADGTSARPSTGRKRSQQLYFGDESSAFDALQTLADLSMNILLPTSNIESESSVQVKEEKNVDYDENHGMPESMPPNHQRNKSKVLEKKDRRPSIVTGPDVATRRNATLKVSSYDTIAASEIKQQTCKTITKVQKRKKKFLQGKQLQIQNNDAESSEPQKTEVLVEEGKRTVSKFKRGSQVTPIPKQGKFIKPQERPASTDLGKPWTDLTETTVQVSSENQFRPPAKIWNRRKIYLKKVMASNMLKPNDSAGDDSAGRFLHLDNDKVVDLKNKLSHCLSCPLLRRWCVSEWFYSAIDYPWFAKNEFVEYLNHARLGHVPHLARVEWGVIRSSLGKPRRFSRKFLQEERDKLEHYRESVRTHYAELRAGVKDGLPTDLARPLSVGQRVIACHAKMRVVHDGSILTVDRNRCRVQFDRPELGVEFMLDIECMPLNPSENVPEAFRMQNNIINKYCNGFMETKLDDQPKEWRIGSSLKFGPSENMETVDGNPQLASSYPINALMKQAKGDTIGDIVQAKATVNEVAAATQQAMYSRPGTPAQIQAREADIRALAELACALDKKEALLIELRRMKEEVSGTQENEPIKDLQHFQKQYAMAIQQLRDVNGQISSGLLYLKQRNTYHGNSMPTLLSNTYHENSALSVGPPGSSYPSVLLNNDSGSHIIEIIHSSKRKARMMVDTAVRAMCDLKEDEDAFVRVGKALDSADIRTSGPDHSKPPVRCTLDPGYDSSTFQDRTASCKNNGALSPKSPLTSDANEVQLPMELISSCVATLYMIQSCTERQYPPAEVAHILDTAVMSLQPLCRQNLTVYREIESCMGIIKNQMLARIPIPTTVLPAESPVL